MFSVLGKHFHFCALNKYLAECQFSEKEKAFDRVYENSFRASFTVVCNCTPRVSDPGLCTLNEGRFLEFYQMMILDNVKSILFVFIRLVSDIPLMSYIQKTSLDPNPFRILPDPESGAIGLTEDVWHQNHEHKRLPKIFIL